MQRQGLSDYFSRSSKFSMLRDRLHFSEATFSRWVCSLRNNITGWQVLRIVLGVTVLTAALFKVHELSTTPYLDKFPPRWAMIVFVEFEILFALWLFFVPKKLFKLIWLATLGLFSFFACITLYKALTGEASCGCFGRVEINPWYTLVFDSTVVWLLLWFRPRGKRFVLKEIWLSVHFLRSYRGVTSLLGVGIIWLIFCIPSAWSMVGFAETNTHDDLSALGQVFNGLDGKLTVVLEPEKWIGRECPLLDYVESNNESGGSLNERLSEGTWNIVLVHRSCSDCKTLLSQLTDSSIPLPGEFDMSGSVAIFEISEDGEVENTSPSLKLGFSIEHNVIFGGCIRKDFVDLFAKTPVLLVLRHGVVVFAKKEWRSCYATNSFLPIQ